MFCAMTLKPLSLGSMSWVATYLHIVGKLRAAGLKSCVVFVSSNKNDYAAENGSTLKPDLATEFAALGIEYAPNLGAAKHLLGV
jgi:hypothetical protein